MRGNLTRARLVFVYTVPLGSGSGSRSGSTLSRGLTDSCGIRLPSSPAACLVSFFQSLHLPVQMAVSTRSHTGSNGSRKRSGNVLATLHS